MDIGVVRVHAEDSVAGSRRSGEGGRARLGPLGARRRPAWLGEELDWLRGVDAAGTPVLGRLLRRAGAVSSRWAGRSRRPQRPEIGWFDIDGSSPVGGTWFQWHSDTFTAPPGARELGRNATGLQGYELRRHLAIQFHPEVTPAIVDDWISVGGRELADNALDAHAIRARTEREAARARAAAYALLDAWAAG